MLSTEEAFHVPPRFQELPLATVLDPTAAARWSAMERLPVSRAVPPETSASKPVPALPYVELRLRVREPGLPLSVKPCLAFLNEMLLRTVWAVAGAGLPPPSLKPLPSPAKSGKFQRLNPLPYATVFSIVTGEANSQASKPSSTLFHSRAPRTTLPVPVPSLTARPSALSPFLRGSRLP